MKRFPKNRLSTEPEYDKKCLQLLEHNFMVEQYLKQSTGTHSSHSQYIHLLNQIAFNNKNKKRKIRLLKHQNYSLASKSQESQRSVKEGNGKEAARWNEMLYFQKKILEQEDIKNTLLAELNQISKSVNLMKGDVSRIIQKNQSTNILQKKTSKVKLLAHDQLKKVNLALHKDHAQILQRNNMQIRFNKKLKNICNSQNNFLKKIQFEYLRHQKRKNLLNQKIGTVQEVMKNLSEREKAKQEINIMNEKNRVNFQELMNLVGLIRQQHCTEQQKRIQTQQDSENLIDTCLSLKTQRFKTKIKSIQTEIVQYVKEIKFSIQQAEKEFESNTQKLNQYKKKFKIIEQEQENVQSIVSTTRQGVSQEENHCYQQKLAQFKAKLNLLLIFWEFIKNNTRFTRLIDQNQQNQLILSKKTQNLQSRFYRRSMQFQKKTSVLREQNNFSNKLYNLLSFLAGSKHEQTNIQSQFIIKSLEMTIIMWLKGFKNLIIQEMKDQRFDKFKKARSVEGIVKYKSTFNLQDEQTKQNKYRISFSDEEEEDKLKTMLQLTAPKKIISFQHNEGYSREKNHTHKQRRTQGDEQVKANRIKVLQKVDYDYYKMLKNVLKIQKQNTKKNYDFNKTFNRSKFTQKNILQQQKRYQCNFALEFIKKNQQGIVIQSHRSIASKKSERDKPSRKRRQFHHKTQLMMDFKVDQGKQIKKVEPKMKFKQSGFNIQRTSKLLEKRSQSISIAKQNRASLLSRKKPLINFAESAIREQY